MIVNYEQLEEAIANQKPYKHGSSHAVFHAGISYDRYDVYSYSTLMLTLTLRPGFKPAVTFWNDKKYSQTTSRLQRIIARHYDVREVINYAT